MNIFRFAFSLLVALMPLLAFAQADFSNPASLAPGENTLPVSGIRATGFYTFTASEDGLVTLMLPSADAQVYLSTQPEENPSTSELPVMTRKYPEQDLLRTRFAAKEGEKLYIKITFICWEVPEEGRFSFDASFTATGISGGESPESAITVIPGKETYIPLGIGADDMPLSRYLCCTTTQHGYLVMEFEPSVTQVKYRTSPGDDFKPLHHIYLSELGTVYGAKATLDIAPGMTLEFDVKGFSPVVALFSEIDPEPGTMCDYPFDINPGTVTLPAAAGDWYYRLKPEERGFIEINSDLSLPGGSVEVMMDCNGFGSFLIEGELSLRCFVWDNMEYIIHIHKAEATPEDQTFTVAVGPELPCDGFDTAAPLTPGETTATPPYAGIYYYKVEAPDLVGSKLKLSTATTPGDSRTRVNLYAAGDESETLARGLDLSYTVAPKGEYILQFTVFDNRLPIIFSIAFEGGEAGIGETDADSENRGNWFTTDGKRIDKPAKGQISIRRGRKFIRH